jgi:predicted nicotinamide N-methyase
VFILSKQFLDHFAPVGYVDSTIPVLMHKTLDFFNLWESLEKESGQLCDVPFWAVAWPAARALSAYILQQPDIFKDKSVLDFGCGCGLAGITACLNGASVTLNDKDPLALHVSSVNSSLNCVSCTISSEDLLLSSNVNNFDIILIADCFYEKSISARIQTFLSNQFKKGTEIIIADAQRPFTPRHMGPLLFKVMLDVDFSIEGTTKREVTLFKYHP